MSQREGRGRRARHRRRGLPARLPRRTARSSGRPAWWWPPGGTDGRATRPLQDARASTRRPPRRTSRRPTASSRASTTRTATRATRPPRSASRRSPQAHDVLGDPDKRKQYDRGGDVRLRGSGARRRLRPRRLLPAASATSSPTSSAAHRRRRWRRTARARPQPERGRDLETDVAPLLRPGGRGAQVSVTVPRPPVHDLPRHGRAPGPRPRSARSARGGEWSRGPGAVLHHPALLALPRHRHGDRGPLPDLPRQRRRAHGQALQGQRPGRRAGRQPRPAGRQGRARAATAARPATSTWSPT